MIFYELFKKYEIEITYMFYGFCLAFLGYFMVTIPAPIGSATGMLCALILYNDIKSNYDDYIDKLLIGFFLGQIVFPFLSPPLIICKVGTIIIGSIIGGIVSGIIISPTIEKDFKVLIVLLCSIMPLFNTISLSAYLMLSVDTTLIGFISWTIYNLFLLLTYIIVNKKDLSD